MKKIGILSLVLFIATIFLTGCGVEKVEGTLEDIMEKVYSNIPEDERPAMLENIEVTDENVEYYLGTSDIEYEEAIASESMTGSIAHSVVLVRTKKNADIEGIMSKIKENVNPRKWICVGVEKEDVIVKNKGDLIILIISQNNRDQINKGFDNL